MIERWQGGSWKAITLAAIGPFNFHRALQRTAAIRVGHFSHGCLVVQHLLDHWLMCQLLGYPEHGPTLEQSATLRASLYIVNVSPGASHADL